MEREKVYRIVEERKLASFANNSRWDSFLSRILSYRIPARLKNVAWSHMSDWSGWIVPVSNHLEVVSAGPVHFREIEWIDFNCGNGEVEKEACIAAAREAKLTFEVADQIVRVFGYR